MDETELDFEYEEPLESLEYLEEAEVADEDQEDLWVQEYAEPEPKNTVRKPRKKKIIIPSNTHPIEIFMLTKDFGWGELTGISGLAKEVLVGIIRGDAVTDDVRKRLRVTTGIIL